MRIVDRNLLKEYLNQSQSSIISKCAIDVFFKLYGYEHDKDIKIEEDKDEKK